MPTVDTAVTYDPKVAAELVGTVASLAGPDRADLGLALTAGRNDRLVAIRLTAIGLAPFAAGALLANNQLSRKTAGFVRCPVRATTGLPCPSCGSGRAFLALAAGDSNWRNYNDVAVFYAALIGLSGIGLNVLRRDRRRRVIDRFDRAARILRERPWLAAGLLVIVALPAWSSAWGTESP